MFIGSKKATNSRMSLHPSKLKKSSKPGVEAFGCLIPQSIINLAKDYIQNNKQWDITVFPDETHFTTINAVAWNRLENLPNRDKDGRVLAVAFERLLEHMMKTSRITISESMKYSPLIHKLAKQQTPSAKKRQSEQRSSTPIIKRQWSVTPVHDQESDEEMSETYRSFDYKKEKKKH